MKLVPTVSLAFALATLSMSTTWAVPPDEHQAHHPADAASGSPSTTMPTKIGSDMARMDTQMKAMREMHEKMMAANSPDERRAVVAEHMQSMKDGMAMMNGSAGGGRAGAKGMKSDMPAQHQMMEKRMEMMQTMMQTMMQMMMDRLPAAPAG